MQVLQVLTINLAVVCVVFLLLWVFCLWLKDVTIVDSYWAIGMGVLATATFLQFPESTPRRWLLLGLCWLWAIRLGGYLFWRWRDHGPDRRYRRMMEISKERRGWGFAKSSLLLVFVTQAPLQFIVSLPVQLGQISMEPKTLGSVAWLGAAIAVFGIVFEAIADAQLTAFRKETKNAGKVLSTGLWKYSRHPNYFGEACVWWGLFLIAAETHIGIYSIVGPVLLTWLLIKWSGLPTLEYRMRKSKSGYVDYIETTSAFLPFPPRKRARARHENE
jgi:steroid 5-alpha reductase family enzyme